MKRSNRPLSLESLETRFALDATVSGFVHVDADEDGARDSIERGIPGVVVQLTGGASVDRSTMTDDNGFYTFTGLAAGTYQVSERQPPAFIDSRESTSHSGAVVASDQITNLVLTTDQTSTENNFGERGVRPTFAGSRLRLASTPPQVALRETNARAEELSGNTSLAESIRTGADTDPDDGNGGTTPNQPFGAVTPGDFDDAGLLGTRTDLVTGAPAITQTHVSTAVDYAGTSHSNPPTYGPHHPVVGTITPRPTGVYTTQQPDEDLVHNLEHGHVWISYNPSLISASDRTALEQLVTDGGTNTGVILTPRSQNTTAIALASWAHLLTLNSFDAAQVRAFVEANRGHAPEGFIPSGQKPAGGDTVDDGLLHTQSPLQAFPPVTPGPVTDPNLRGTRTDTQSGAAPVTQTHVTTAVNYSSGHSNPPSYGDHHGVVRDDDDDFITPRPTGIYTTEQPDEDLVHNLEHGHVWISYDPGLITATDRTALENLVNAGGTDTGVILTPPARNTSAIVLTSWTRQLSLTTFNATTIRDFIVTNRGHSPEGFIPSGQKATGAASENLDDDFDHTPP